jgi:hypothetical protein
VASRLFALIAALMSVSQDAEKIDRSPRIAAASTGMPAPFDDSAADIAVDATRDERQSAASGGTDDREIARWLESLTYAVLALAGFAAACLLVLLRMTWHLARIADAR